jgi:AcrR family transcriptional regulator
VSQAATEPRRRPGRPDTGAAQRVLDGAYEVLAREGYAGMTTAKVAAASGQNKALIAYHFGSKEGLVAEVGRGLAESITEEVLGGLGRPRSVAAVVRGVLAGLWRVMDRDERLARLYFDLAAVSVVEPDVRAVMREMKASWRKVIRKLLAGVSGGPRTSADAEAAAIYVMAGLEGLALERLDRGETPGLKRARELFVRSAAAAVGR